MAQALTSYHCVHMYVYMHVSEERKTMYSEVTIVFSHNIVGDMREHMEALKQ